MKDSQKHATELRNVSSFKGFVVNLSKLMLALVLITAIVFVAALGITYHTFVYTFKHTAGLTNNQIIQIIRNGLNTPIQQTEQHKNILLLGIDQLSNRAGDPVLTDTIMLFSLDVQTGDLQAISLPRDLWSTEYETKINSLYEYGKQRYPDKPEQFPTEVIEELTQVDIHHTVVLSLDQLKELIDLLGGISVEIPESFVDEQFPRTDVDIRTERNPEKLYERVEFTEGMEVMNGERALKYIRSCYSNSVAGTDDARTIRQQLVINAILSRLKNNHTLYKPEILGKLFTWYNINFNKTLDISEIVQLIVHIGPRITDISLKPQTFSFQTEESVGVLFHPPISKHGQWVYEVQDIDRLRLELKQKLGLK